MPPKNNKKAATRPHPYEMKETRKSSRQSKKRTDIEPEQFSNSTLVADDQIPGPSNVSMIDSSSQNVVSVNSLNDNSFVSRSEFVQLQSNVEKILASLNQLQTANNAVSSFTTEKSVNDIQGHNDGVSINMSQEVDTTGPQVDPNLNQVNFDVQNAVATGLDKILHPSTSGENFTLNLPGRPLDLKISNKIKQQIWSNEYIELDCLLDSKQEESTSYQLVSTQGGPISITPNKASRKINGLGQWCSAFMVYMTIYCKKYPDELSDLTTYLSKIKLLSHRGGDYLTYDREFRLLRQATNMPFSIVHASLWLECRDAKVQSNQSNNKQSHKAKNNFRPQQSNTNKSTHPYGYCFKYHDSGKCPKGQDCMFSHSCYTEGCLGKHPVFKCYKNQNDKKQQGPNQQRVTENKIANSNKSQ